MYRLDKFILDGVRYLVWSSAADKLPEPLGVACLLSDREGVGADRLVVPAAGHPWGICCFGADGEACAVEASDRRVAALVGAQEAKGRGVAMTEADASLEYSEVRLTEAFFRRLMKSGCAVTIAG